MTLKTFVAVFLVNVCDIIVSCAMDLKLGSFGQAALPDNMLMN